MLIEQQMLTNSTVCATLSNMWSLHQHILLIATAVWNDWNQKRGTGASLPISILSFLAKRSLVLGNDKRKKDHCKYLYLFMFNSMEILTTISFFFLTRTNSGWEKHCEISWLPTLCPLPTDAALSLGGSEESLQRLVDPLEWQSYEKIQTVHVPHNPKKLFWITKWQWHERQSPFKSGTSLWVRLSVTAERKHSSSSPLKIMTRNKVLKFHFYLPKVPHRPKLNWH